jgi:hypothetical protein
MHKAVRARARSRLVVFWFGEWQRAGRNQGVKGSGNRKKAVRQRREEWEWGMGLMC